MGSKDQLRRYLEQRREAGERELVLDGLTVDDVLRIVGALGEGARPGTIVPSRPPDAGPVPPLTPSAASAPPGGVGAPGPSSKPPVGADWRAVLSQADRAVPLPRGAEPRGRPGSGSGPPATVTPPPPARDRGGRAAGNAETEVWPGGIVVGQAAGDLFGGPLAKYRSLEDVARGVAACTQCPLYGTAAHPVPGEGSATARLVCVGEAPGATEDATGRPFVGPAGKLLDKILGAIQLAREDVFICNVLKHRPPGNRNPQPSEVTACVPFLVRQLELIAPGVIVAFGTFAAQTLLRSTQPIGKLRGAVHRYYGVPLIVTYHPAALLRNPAWKRPTWEDVQYARRILDGTGL